MATVRLSDIEGMLDQGPMPNTERITLEFLELFDPARPLDQEEFEEWIQVSELSTEEVKEAAKEAVRMRWVEDTPDGLMLTNEGRHKMESDCAEQERGG